MQRRRETSSERYKRLIRQRRIFVLSVFILVIVLCVCLFTPLFGITEITVSGNAVLSSEDVIATSGIEKGENVFRVSKSKAVKALSGMAYVEGAKIKRKFPARIEIEIDEATPDIILDTPTEFVVTTIGGRVLEKTGDVSRLTSPIVYGINVTWAEPANNIETEDSESLAMHIERIGCFYETEYWGEIDEFYVSDISNFMMVMKSGMKVTFGSIDSTESLQRKIKMLAAILPQIEQTERSYLDLTTDKGYFGEYTEAELEEMKRSEEGDTDSEEESETDEDNSGDSEKSDDEKDSSDEEVTSRKKASASSSAPQEEDDSSNE